MECGAGISCPPCSSNVLSTMKPYDLTCTNHNAATFVSGSFLLQISFDVLREITFISCHFSYIVLCGVNFIFILEVLFLLYV